MSQEIQNYFLCVENDVRLGLMKMIDNSYFQRIVCSSEAELCDVLAYPMSLVLNDATIEHLPNLFRSPSMFFVKDQAIFDCFNDSEDNGDLSSILSESFKKLEFLQLPSIVTEHDKTKKINNLLENVYKEINDIPLKDIDEITKNTNSSEETLWANLEADKEKNQLWRNYLNNIIPMVFSAPREDLSMPKWSEISPKDHIPSIKKSFPSQQKENISFVLEALASKPPAEAFASILSHATFGSTSISEGLLERYVQKIFPETEGPNSGEKTKNQPTKTGFVGDVVVGVQAIDPTLVEDAKNRLISISVNLRSLLQRVSVVDNEILCQLGAYKKWNDYAETKSLSDFNECFSWLIKIKSPNVDGVIEECLKSIHEGSPLTEKTMSSSIVDIANTRPQFLPYLSDYIDQEMEDKLRKKAITGNSEDTKELANFLDSLHSSSKVVSMFKLKK